MTSWSKKLSFIYNEFGLDVSRREMAAALAEPPDAPPRLERFLPGRGWGLKYLAFKAGQSVPYAVIKASSSIIERRLKVKLAGKYVVPSRRFALEAELLARLAALDLGPSVLLCRQRFFAREYLDGMALDQLPVAEIAARLPAVLGAIERSCGGGVFHTDLNAGNVIIRPAGRVGFIDCEVPTGNSGDPPGERDKRYCHERLLHSLPLAADGNNSLLAEVAARYYEAAADPALTPERAKTLVNKNDTPLEFPL